MEVILVPAVVRVTMLVRLVTAVMARVVTLIKLLLVPSDHGRGRGCGHGNIQAGLLVVWKLVLVMFSLPWKRTQLTQEDGGVSW